MALRVGVDVTPLLGVRTGVAAFVENLLDVASPDVELVPFAISLRSGRNIATLRRGLARPSAFPMPAAGLFPLWGRYDHPRVELWTGRIDLVHGTNFVAPPTSAVSLVTVHDLTALRYPELCSRQSLRFPKLVCRSIRRGGHVHVPTASVGEEVMEAFDIETDRVHVVHHGMSEKMLGTTDPDVARRLAGADEYVLALGTVEPRKDYPSLVRAFDRFAESHPDVSLVLAGAHGWGAVELEEALRQARHRDRIRLLGFVDDSQRGLLLAGAALLAYPSIYEGFGLPPLEAMQAGTPVVATRTPAVTEVVADAGVLVDIGDIEGFSQAMADVFDDAENSRSLVEKGHRRIKHFSMERFGTEMLALYRRIVDQ